METNLLSRRCELLESVILLELLRYGRQLLQSSQLELLHVTKLVHGLIYSHSIILLIRDHRRIREARTLLQWIFEGTLVSESSAQIHAGKPVSHSEAPILQDKTSLLVIKLVTISIACSYLVMLAEW